MLSILNNLAYLSLFSALYFEVFLLITFLEGRKTVKEETASKPARLPLVSIIVPCWNEENTIAKTLDSLLALEYPKERYEIIVINDGSTDNTQKTLETYATHPHLSIFHKENGGKHTALNMGIEKARGEIIGCLDADSLVAPDALREIVKYFDDTETMAVIPAIQVWQPRTLLQHLQRTEYEIGIFVRKSFAMLSALAVTPGPFSFFRKSVFETLGGYRAAHHTEDMELAMRMQKAHYKIVNAHTARVYTNTPATLKMLYKQRLRWAYGFIQNARDYRELLFNRHYGNVSFFTLPLGIFSIFSALVMFLLAGANTIQLITQKIGEWSAVNFNLTLHTPTFDLFYFNTTTIVILEVVAIFLMLTIVMSGRNLARGTYRPGFDVLYFFLFFLYGFLAPLWLGSAVWRVARARTVSWR